MTRSGSTVHSPWFSKNERANFRVPAIVAVAALLALGAPTVVLAQSQRGAAHPPAFGTLKICKVAGPGVAVGTPFKFSFGTLTVTVPAGPAPGGACVIAASNLNGASVNIKEVTAGYTVTSITTNGQIAPGTLNLLQRTVTVFPPLFGHITEVTYTNTHIGKGQQTGYLEICKNLGALLPPNSYPLFSFTVQTQPVTVLANACSPAIQVIAGTVVVTETTPANLTDCNTLPAAALITCDIANHTATVNVAAGQISSETILTVTNCVSDIPGGCPPGPNVCPNIDTTLHGLSLPAGGTITPAFQKEASIALEDGCVVYTSSLNLYLEFIRGPGFVGTSISIGALAPTTPSGGFFTDIALTSGTSAGTLYGIDNANNLYVISRVTGFTTLVGPVTGLVGGDFVNGLVVGPDGKIWASGQLGHLYTITTAGLATLVGAGSTLPAVSSGDLAFTQTGSLYMTAVFPPGNICVLNDYLVQLNTTTGSPTTPPPASISILAQHAFAMASSYNTLFAVMSPQPTCAPQSGTLVTISTFTGIGKAVPGAPIGNNIIGGMASPPEKA